MHLVDTTLFYSPTSGGVKRYLTAKHAWLAAHSSWEHTIVVPGREDQMQRGGLCTLAGYPVPATFNYRLPLNPRRWTRLLDALEPTLIEAGDAFHPAWCAWQVAQRRGIPVVGFYHSNVPQIIGRRVGGALEPLIGRYVRCLYERFDLVFAPSRVMCDYLDGLGVQRVLHQPLGVDVEVFHPRRRTLALRPRLGLPSAAIEMLDQIVEPVGAAGELLHHPRHDEAAIGAVFAFARQGENCPVHVILLRNLPRERHTGQTKKAVALR